MENNNITIKANLVKFSTNRKNMLMDCEGNLVWFPKSQIEYNKKEKKISIPEWLYKQKFPNEPY